MKSKAKSDLAKNIKILRISRNMTQPQLAEELGVSVQTISRWENDQNDIKHFHLEMIADLFNIRLDNLMGTDIANTAISKKFRSHITEPEPQKQTLLEVLEYNLKKDGLLK